MSTAIAWTFFFVIFVQVHRKAGFVFHSIFLFHVHWLIFSLYQLSFALSLSSFLILFCLSFFFIYIFHFFPFLDLSFFGSFFLSISSI